MHEKPHPLALALAAQVDADIHAGNDADDDDAPAEKRSRRALLLGGGLGRNIPPLLAAGLRIDVLDEDATCVQAVTRLFADNPAVRTALGSYQNPGHFVEHYDAVLSTHALLHGDEASIEQTMQALRTLLCPSADLLFTFGSIQDARFGNGRRIDARTWAATEGGEKDVPHVFYDEVGVRALLAPFTVLSLREVHARETVGRWAHQAARTPDIVHWYVHARSPS